jgi:MFS family permease
VTRLSPAIIWALGVTQVIGYGTLYYSYSVLAPELAVAFGWSIEWVFGALTVALLLGGVAAPFAGHLAERFGAARLMVWGSLLSGLLLGLSALATDGWQFALALIGMEVASTLVLYATAFSALVQMGGQGAQRSITHLTLIAGFASTLFWPLTSALLAVMDWRGVYLVFGLLHLVVCAPLHFWLARQPAVAVPAPAATTAPLPEAGLLAGKQRRSAFTLMLIGFAIQGFTLSAVLLQMLPLLTGLGLGSSAVLIGSLFGPAQVLSRFVNMLFGRGLPQTWLAIAAAGLLPAGLLVLALATPAIAGAVLFAILFGLGSGLTSIVSGSLPLYLLGRHGYAARLGWLSAARQIASAIAPFVLALAMGALGIVPALWLVVGVGLVAVLAFGAIAMLPAGASPERHPAGLPPIVERG